MKIVCQSCGKKYDTAKDELCPRCGSYNPFEKEGGVQQETSAERYVRQQMEQEKQRLEERYEQADEPSFDLKQEEETRWNRREFSQRKEEERQASKQNRGCLGSVIVKFFLFFLLGQFVLFRAFHHGSGVIDQKGIAVAFRGAFYAGRCHGGRRCCRAQARCQQQAAQDGLFHVFPLVSTGI